MNKATKKSPWILRFGRAVLLAILVLGQLIAPPPVQAAAVLTVTPITWNVIGLDSNNVNAGPNEFPIGARVCNSGDAAATSLVATFNWDSSNPYINSRPGTYTTLPTISSLAGGNTCTDVYFEVEVTRNASAYDTRRSYHIAVSASGGVSGSTVTPRELYVEHLVSQSRNSVTDMQLSSTSGSSGFASIPQGGSLALVVGNTYWIKLVGATATNGYDQIESFINFPNTIFQVQSATTTYTAGTTPTTTLYGDACTWINDPNSPNYRSCSSTGKQGGNINVVYQVQVLSVPTTPLANPGTLGTLIYDFSGSSYHYNGDFGISTRFVTVTDPTQASISKAFNPSSITVNGVSRLTITINNTNPAVVSGYNFTDPLPSNLKVAATPNASTSSCGSPTFAPAGDATTLTFSSGTIAANGTCTIQVDVTATSTSGSPYTNTTNHLFVGSSDTGKFASASLTVGTAAAPPSSTCNVELATWNMSGSSAPPAYTFKSSYVSSATTSYAGAGTTSVSSSAPNPPVNPTDSSAVTNGGTANFWYAVGDWAKAATGYPNAGTSPYYEISLDTSLFTNVAIEFDYYLGGNWASAGNNTIYVYSNANGGSFSTAYQTPAATISLAKDNWYNSHIIHALASGSSTTAFRINFTGAQGTSSFTALDNIRVIGCRALNPPTLTKSFSPSPAAVGGNSTLTLTVTNPNLSPSATLTGSSFDDFLPSANLQGTVALTNASATVTGTGTAFRSQLAANSIVTFSSTPEAISGTIAVTQGSATVTGTSTLFTSELPAGSIIQINSVRYIVSDVISDTSLRLSYNYAGSPASGLSANRYRTYTVQSIASDTSLTLSSTYAGSNQSGLTMSSGLTLAAAPTTTCRGTVSGGTGGGVISLSGSRLSGTISVSAASATVTGSGSAFQTQLQPGSRISINSVNYRVSAIASQTSLTLSSNYAGSTASGLTYTYGDALQGTLAVTNNSTTVTGTGTAFLTQLVPSDIIYINNVRYQLASAAISSNTSLTLAAAYTGPTASGLSYYPERMLRGTMAVTNLSPNVTGTSTFFTSELAASGLIYINGVRYTISSITDANHLILASNYTGTTASLVAFSQEDKAGLAGGGSATCTVTASVRANASGVRANVSESISSTESGTSTAASGYASANLTAVIPALISKEFSPNPIQTGGTSTLTFTLTNPNQNDALSGVKFSDPFPSGVTVSSPLTTSNTCSSGGTAGTLYSSAGTAALAIGDSSIRLGSSTDTNMATIAAGGNCTITVKVTASTITTNLSGTVSVTNNSTAVTGSGTAFSTELAVDRAIYINSQRYIVAAISDNTHLTLSSAYTGSTQSGVVVPSGLFNVSGTVAHIVNGTTYTGLKAADTLMVNAVNPKIAIQKQLGASATGPWYTTLAVAAGSSVYYKFTVENTGDVPFASFTVSDPTLVPAGGNLVSCSWSSATLPVGTASVEPTSTCVYGPISAVSGSHPNTATAHGSYNSSIYNSATDTATYQTTSLALVKTAAESYYAAAGNILHYSYQVTNNGSASLAAPVTVTDNKATVTCPAVSSAGDLDSWFDPSEVLTCTASYTILAGDVGSGKTVDNSASASADGVNSSIANLSIPYNNLDLTVAIANNVSGVVQVGSPFTWTLTMSAGGDVSNTGAVFSAGQTIVSAPLPAGPAYGSVTPASFISVTNSGNIACSISSNTLTCTASGGSVTIASGGSFTAPFSVTPATAATLSTTATIDPVTVITETNESNNTASNSVLASNPTAVTVYSFSAVRSGSDSVLLSWLMAANPETAGFNLYRRLGADGPEVKLNPTLILVDLTAWTDTPYVFEDNSAAPGSAYTYRLECLDASLHPLETRTATLHDHVLFLPLLRK